MSCSGKKLVLFFLFACMLNGMAYAQKDRLYFRNFNAAENSDLYNSRRIADKIKHLVDGTLSTVQGKSKVVITELDRTGKLDRVKVSPGKRRHEMIIRLPGAVRTWNRDMEQLCDLVSWYVLAKLGRGPDHAAGIRSHWIVRAMARKIAVEESPASSSLPFIRSYPMTYALAANGILPSFDSILTVPPAGTPDAIQMLSDEYAALLLDICQQSGLIRKGLGEKLLVAELDGFGNTSFSFFAEAAEVSMRQKTQNVLLNYPNGKEAFFLAWFELYANHILLTFFTPVSAPYFEILYRRNAMIRITDKKTMEIRSVPFSALKNTKIAPDSEEIAAASLRLAKLALVTPPTLLELLSDVRLAVERLRSDKSESCMLKVEEAEKRLFGAIGSLDGIERYMKVVQERQIAPGVRMASVLLAARKFRQEERSDIRLNKLLDKWDE